MAQRLREAQMRVLGQAAKVALRDRMGASLREFWPELSAELDEESAMEEFLGKAIQSCERYGLTAEADHFRYLNVMALLGTEFDSKYRWAAEVLGQASRRGSSRMDEVCELAAGQAVA